MIRVGLFLAWSGLIVLVMLIPLPGLDLIWIGQLDALVHFSLFLILGGLLHRTAGEELDLSGPLVVISCLLLVGPETLQHYVPTRSFSWLDLFFNLSGLVNGFLLVGWTHSLTYVGLGGLVLGGAYATSLFKQLLFNLVFTPIPPVVSLVLPALNFALVVLLFAVFSRSVSARFVLGIGGLLHFAGLRMADEPIVTTLAGGLLLVLITILLLDYSHFIPTEVAAVLRPIALVLLVTTIAGATVDKPFFLLHAGPVIVVGLMLGVLVTLAVEGPTGQRVFSRRSSGHS